MPSQKTLVNSPDGPLFLGLSPAGPVGPSSDGRELEEELLGELEGDLAGGGGEEDLGLGGEGDLIGAGAGVGAMTGDLGRSGDLAGGSLAVVAGGERAAAAGGGDLTGDLARDLGGLVGAGGFS